MFKRLKSCTVVLGLAACGLAAADDTALISPGQILEGLSPNKAQVEKTAEGEPTSLLTAVQAFSRSGNSLDSSEVARQWVSLLVQSIGKSARSTPTVDTFDLKTMASVSAASLIAALPEPTHWQAIVELIESGEPINALTESQQSAIRLIGSALKGDAKAQHFAATEMEQSLKAQGSFDETLDQSDFDDLLTRLSVATGDKDSTIASIEKQYNHGQDRDMWVELPDLVTLYGESVATQLLKQGLESPNVKLDIEKGVDTIELAQRVALSQIDELKEPQWSLIRTLDAVELYEAMDERFGAAVSRGSRARKKAQLVYLFGLIVRGDADKANQVAARMKSDYGWGIPQKLILDLDKQGYTREVAQFLEQFLAQNVDAPLWHVYSRLAVATDRETEALALVEKAIDQATVKETKDKLANHRLDILLSIDRIPEALDILRTRIADVGNEYKFESAVELARITELVGPKAEFDDAVGLAIAEAVKRIEKASGEGYADLEPVFELIKLLRDTGASRKAQDLALQIVHSQKPEAGSAAGFSAQSEDFQLAGIELVGLYAEAEAYEDLMRFVHGYQYWGSRDVAGLLSHKDSHGDYVSFLIAKALAETGKSDDAVRILEALMFTAGGYDPAYQLYTEILGPKALPFLAKRSRLDRFQERPLVWAAAVHYQQGDYETAKTTVQQAIAIDPSDGEQGPGHRMRAYAILSDIMAALDQPKESEKFHDAVAAIRLSETADRYRDLNMHTKALALYREAADQFQYAYCIQSRLAISLSRRGQHAQAAEHYQRAYELMPSSFGRVESHCFGCESVFADSNAQEIADTVFTDMIAANPSNPQVHYMQAYLRVEQGRYADAIPLVRKAVALDPEYLNAWKLLFRIGEQVQLPAWEHDIAAIRMLELDPLERHVRVDRGSITDLKALWDASAVAIDWSNSVPKSVYPLVETEKFQEKQMLALPEDLQFMLKVQRMARNYKRDNAPGIVLLNNKSIRSALTVLAAP